MKKIEEIHPCKKEKKNFEDTLSEHERKKVEQLINVGLVPARQNVSCRVADTLQDSFVYLYANRNRESMEIRIITENFVQLYNQTIHIFSQHGVEDIICDLLPMFRKLKLSELLPSLEWEQALFSKAGIDHTTVVSYGDFLDQHLAETIALVENGNFSLDLLKIPDNCGYLGSHEGNSWEGFVGFLSGVVLVTNLVCTIPTAGLAAASVVVGVAGGGYAIAH